MARGWESKSVESQIESARSDAKSTAKKSLPAETAEGLRKKETLRLARTHLLDQIRSCQNFRHREMMEKALADLEQAISQLQ